MNKFKKDDIVRFRTSRIKEDWWSEVKVQITNINTSGDYDFVVLEGEHKGETYEGISESYFRHIPMNRNGANEVVSISEGAIHEV